MATSCLYRIFRIFCWRRWRRRMCLERWFKEKNSKISTILQKSYSNDWKTFKKITSQMVRNQFSSFWKTHPHLFPEQAPNGLVWISFPDIESSQYSVNWHFGNIWVFFSGFAKTGSGSTLIVKFWKIHPEFFFQNFSFPDHELDRWTGKLIHSYNLEIYRSKQKW